jgi:phosphoenolpyruvate-protein phosphotransferase
MNEMKIYAPVAGKVIPLSKVPDPVFAEKVLGDGLAVESGEEKKVTVKAPVAGTITTLNKNLHALVIQAEDGTEILIHIGVDTVNLGGKGFKALVKEGKKVKAGDGLVKVDLKYVREHAPASMVIVLVTDKPEAVVKPTAAETVQENDDFFSFSEGVQNGGETTGTQSTATGGLKSGEWITIVNPNGLHARPAANLAKQAKIFGSAVQIEKENGECVDAKGSIAIMRLNLAKGDRARFWSAEEKALETLTHYLQNGAGEDVRSQATAKHLKAPEMNTGSGPSMAPVNFSTESKVNLDVASPGLAMGTVYLLVRQERNTPEKADGSVEKELEKLDDALRTAGHAVKIDMNTAGDEAKAILDAHLSFIEDPGLHQEAVKLIGEGKSAPYAWQQVTKAEAAQLASSSNSYMAARAADLRDVGDRVLDVLLGEEPAPDYPENSIVVAEDLTPSNVTHFNKNVMGVVTVFGSRTGHAAIMMRNSGVPSLFNAPQSVMNAPQGIKLIIDTENKILIVNPAEATQQSYKEKIDAVNKRKEEAFATAKEEGATKDGHRVEISGNVSSVAEGVKATEQGGEGYGLARSEFLFYGRQTAPTEEEQRELYQGLLDATKYDVTVRLLDAGGDKPIVYVKGPKEDNPLLGIRGMRIHDDNPEIYRTQIRALLQCRPLSRLKIMVPMISLIDEVDQMRKLFDDEMAAIGLKKEEGPRFGIMAETPAVMAMAEQFARKVDFFSVGTNDLTQYTLAMDRTSARLAGISNATNPAVLNLIYMLCEGAKQHKVPVAVCGAAASDPVTALLFIGLGVGELAVSGVEIPEIKALIRRYTLAEMQDVAQKALKLSTDAEVVDLVKKSFDIA